MPKCKGKLLHASPDVSIYSDTESDSDIEITPVKKPKVQQPKKADPPPKSSKGNRSALIQASQERAKQIFAHNDEKQEDLKQALQEQREMIRQLQEQLQAKSCKYFLPNTCTL